jgi:multidrug efflux system membrane fusion protein
VEVQQTVINSQEAELDLAEYYLSLTKVKAPVDGYVTNINCRPGDFVKPGEALFGLLDNNLWWVEANYKEYLLQRMKEGQKVWVLTDLYPLTIFEGEIQNFDRAISRTDDNNTILPYISPTTDWIRLSRRFQVRIKFTKKTDDVKFYMGADARTLIFLW